jgi:hypothetical protein
MMLVLMGCGAAEEPIPTETQSYLTPTTMATQAITPTATEDAATEDVETTHEVTATVELTSDDEALTSDESSSNVEDDGDEDVALVSRTEDQCLACHIDKQQLIDTAKDEEEVISESSGEG